MIGSLISWQFINLVYLFIQRLRGAEPSAAPNTGGESPDTGGKRWRQDAPVRFRQRREPEELLLGVRRADGRRRQHGRSELRIAGAGSPEVQQRLAGRGRRELHHDIGLPKV